MDPSYNGFDTQTQQSPIMSSETGDIVLDTSGGTKKSKKGWIIGGILGVLVIAAIVVAILVVGRRSSGSDGDETSLMQQYINYMINCDVNEEVSDVHDEDSLSYLGNEGLYCLSYQVNYATDEEFTEFYDTANGFLDKLFDEIKDEELTDLILEQQELLKMFKTHKDVGVYGKNGLNYLYFNGSFNEKRQLVATSIAELGTTVSDEEGIASQYLELIRDYYGKADIAFGIFSKYGCKESLDNGNDGCDLAEQDYNTWMENYNSLDIVYEDLTELINGALSQYLVLLGEMEDYLNE